MHHGRSKTGGAQVTGGKLRPRRHDPVHVHADTSTPSLGATSLECHPLGGTGPAWARMGLAVSCTVQEGSQTERERGKGGGHLFCWEHLRAAPHLGKPPKAWATHQGVTPGRPSPSPNGCQQPPHTTGHMLRPWLPVPTALTGAT